MIRIRTRSILFLAVALAVVLAGCTGGGGAPTATAAGDADSDGGAGGNDGSGDGGDDGNSDESSGDGADGGDAATPTATATATPTAAPTTAPNVTGPATAERLPTLGEVLKYEDEYRYRIEVDEIDGEAVDYVQEGRWHGENFYARATVEGETFETYDVGGQQYFVSGGECMQLSVDTVRNPNNWTAQESNVNQSVHPIETTTIDGEEVYVYDLQVDGPEGTTTSTIYVSADTGYAVRQEVEGVTIETWDWGNVEPVESPC
jgi:DNA-dependent RNA polymerase auxiliary subunit epsilon